MENNKVVEVNNKDVTSFESIKHIDENGIEFWYARELMPLLEYSKWENFHNVIKKAMLACKNANFNVFEQFPEFKKPIKGGNGNIQNVIDYRLSRYACYLIVQNANPNKESVALGQTYFAIQTRKQELSELEYDSLSEIEKRLYQRNNTKKGNYVLQKIASKAGVKNMAEFHNAGYKGLYNGETAADIAKRKGLRYREDILDNMCSDELADNLFRISQTKQKIINENIQGEENLKKAHNFVGKEVRKTIKRLGGTMPEDFPTPKQSLKEFKSNKNKILEFDDN